jgi:hypothetical protein
MLVEVVAHVELAARGVGIEHAHLDHGLLLDVADVVGARRRLRRKLIPTHGRAIADRARRNGAPTQ